MGGKRTRTGSKITTGASRNRIFTFLRGLVIGDFEAALANLASPEEASGPPWTPERPEQTLESYDAGRHRICLDPNARNWRHTCIIPSDDKKTWRAQQMPADPEGHNDRVAEQVNNR